MKNSTYVLVYEFYTKIWVWIFLLHRIEQLWNDESKKRIEPVKVEDVISRPPHSWTKICSTWHTELKYSIAGVEFQATKQFILSSFSKKLYLSWWSNGLRHQASSQKARSQKAVGSNPTWGDFFLNVHFSKNFFFQNFAMI